MKKNIALFVGIISLITFIFVFQLTLNKDKTLGGKYLENGLYLYNLAQEDNYIDNFTIIENEVYYLVGNYVDELKTEYTLYKINIDTKKQETIENIEAITCSLKERNVICERENEVLLYDLNLNELASSLKENKDYQYNIFPYKDNYIVMENNTLYILNNKKTKFRTIENMDNSFYQDYFYTDDNTYILINQNAKYYLYDINKNEQKEIDYVNYFEYRNGFYFINENTIKIIDLKNDLELEYTNFLEKDTIYSSDISKDNNHFYFYDTDRNSLYIEDFKENTIIEYKLPIKKESGINNIKIDNHFLYILDLEGNLYILNLEEITNKEQDIEEYKKKEEEEVRNIISKIKDNYNVNIKIKEETNIKYPDFYAEVEKDNEKILNALESIEKILSKLNKEFFYSFYDLEYDGLNIYLTGTLSPSNYETQVSNPAAFSLVFKNEYMIVLDIEQHSLEDLLCHELEHNIENNSNYHNKIMFEKWDELNPKDFYYKYSYTENTTQNYTLTEEDKKNVYFIDTYSHTYPTEDRARVFEYVCASTIDIDLKDYPNLNTKAEYIKEEIIKAFPSLEGSLLFNN